MTLFRKRLLQRGNLKVSQELLEEIAQIVLESGTKFGSIQIMDSVYSTVNVNTSKEQGVRRRGKG